jgi:hypothetical protein
LAEKNNVAKRKHKIKKPGTSKSWREWFSWGKRSQTRSSRAEQKEQLGRRIKIAALSIFLPLLPAGLVAGFFYLEKYVHAQQTAQPKYGLLMFVDAPNWAYSEAMKKKLAVTAGGGRFELKEGTAQTVAENLAQLPWLYDVQVRATTQNVLVYAQYRQPQALIKTAKGQTYYVGLLDPKDPLAGQDNTVVVLEHIEVEKPPMPEITGFADKDVPSSGKIWLASDVSAALQLLSALKKMDDKVCPQKPLREEIAGIDVANYNGRKAPAAPHIILNLKDGTQVLWGAECGQSSGSLEAPETEKLTILYTFYQEHKYTLLGLVKVIELRQPQTGIPRPQ